MFTDKVYTGLDHAPAAFDLRGRILGPNGNNLEYIKSETGAVVSLRGGNGLSDPVHVILQHPRSDKMADARSLTLNLIETVKNELQQWSVQNGHTLPPNQVSIPAPIATANAVPETVNIAPAPMPGLHQNSQVVVRPQTVLQLMPQQQYILNQEGNQLIPLIPQGVSMPAHANFTQLITPGAINSFPQGSVGTTQFVDANLQPVSVAQFRLSNVPNSVPFLQNGIAISQVSLANQDTTTVSYTSLLPVSSTVSSPSAALTPTPNSQSANQKIQDKTQFQIQGEQVQLAPSQTMYIPYQQLHDLGQNGGTVQPQLVSITGGGGVNSWPVASSMGLPQLTQLHPGTSLNPNIVQLNHKTGQVISGQPMQISASQGTTLTPIPSNHQWSRPPIAASLPQGAELIPLNSPAKSTVSQEQRGQKRMSDGSASNSTPLRAIAPSGSQSGSQEKLHSLREARWSGSSAREGGTSSGGSSHKGAPRSNTASTNTSTSQTSSSATITPRENTSSPAKTMDKQSQDSMKPSEVSKTQPLSNIQMYAVSNNMQPLQNISPSSMGQQGLQQPSQMYIVPSSQGLQTLSQGVMGQTLQMGQGNVPMIQPNQLSLPQGVQYNTVPLMQLPQQMQYITPGINLNNPQGQQLSLMPGQQILNPTMISNMPQGQNQLTQLNPSMQSLQGQVISGSQNPNLQYGTTQLQNIPQSQFISSQQEVIQGSFPNQFATQQGNIILPSNYAPVGQQMSTQQLNTSVSPTNTNTSQPVTYSVSNTPTSINQQNFSTGVPQAFPQGPSMPALNQQYPSSASPSVNQIVADPAQTNFSITPLQNQEGYPQSNTPNASFANGSAPPNFSNNQFAGNGNRGWSPSQRFPPPSNGITQYNVSARATPPNTAPPPPNIAQTANNSNYWQYT